MEKVWKIIIRITVIIIMLLWPQIKLKKGKKPIYKIALVPRISSFWSFQKAPDPAAATSSSGQPIPTSSNALGILQMSVLGSQGVWSQKASCWSSDACRPAICATSLSLPGKKKKQGEGRMRQEDGTNTSSCNRLIGPLWATSRYKIKTNRASHCALSGLNLPWVYQLVPGLLPSSPFLKDLIMDLSEGSQASFYLKRIRYFASKLETLLEVGN